MPPCSASSAQVKPTSEPAWMPALPGASTEGSASQPVNTGRAARPAGSVMKAQLAPQPADQRVGGVGQAVMGRCTAALHKTGPALPPAPRPHLHA